MALTITPPQPNLADGSDTGSSSSDDITDLPTPTVSGTGAVVGALVTLYDSDGTTVLGTATADGTGTYAIAVKAPLDDGVHALTVTAKASGFDASTPSAVLTVTVDTAAPDAPTAPTPSAETDTGASKLDGVTADGGTGQPALTLTGLAEAGALVRLFNGSSTTPLGQATATADGTYAITLNGLKDATYAFTTTATDVAGNISKPSPASSVTIDTKAPATPAAPTLTPGSDTGILHNDGATSDTTPVIVGTAEANATVELFDTDGLVIGKAMADATGAYMITVATSSELISGAHALTVKAVDAAGNTSAVSDALNIVVDTTPPTATSTPETTNLIFGSIPFDLHFSEPVSGVDASDFTLVTNGTAQGEISAISGSGSDFKVLVDGLSGQGDISLGLAAGATLTDAAGNAATLTESDAVTIDETDTPSDILVADLGPITSEEHGTVGLSSGGRLVSFDTQALGNGAVGLGEVYVKDLRTGGLTLVSAPLAGGASDGDSNLSRLSSNGGVIAFYSTATNLVPGGPTDGSDNFYVATLSTVAPAAGQAATVTSFKEIDTGIGGSNPQYFNGPSDLPAPVVSGDGQHVLFESVAGLTPDSTTLDFSFNLYEENLTDGTLKFIKSGFGDGYSLSSDGSLVAYSSYSDSYVLNTTTGVTTELTGYQTISNYGGLIVNVQNPNLSALGNWVTYDVNYGGSSPRTTVYEQNLVTGRTLQIAPATIGTDDDEGQGVNNGGRYVLYTTNTLGLTTAVPSQLYLQDAVTGTNTAITNGTADV